MVKIDTLFKIEKCETRLTFESETACLSKHAAGPEWEQQQCSFAAWSWQEKSNPDRVPESHDKKYTLFQTEMLICRPCSRLCWVAHPRIAHVWEYPPTPFPGHMHPHTCRRGAWWEVGRTGGELSPADWPAHATPLSQACTAKDHRNTPSGLK